MAHLLSINVGLPRDIAWRGRTVHTGIWKAPVQGRRMARHLNIDGDGQGDLAGHGGDIPVCHLDCNARPPNPIEDCLFK